MEKTCTKCKEIKPVTEFHKYSRAKDGYNPHCKECRSAHARKTHQNKPLRSVMLTEKKCTKCKTLKTAEAFPKAKRTKTGLTSWCKLCQNSYRHQWEKSMKVREIPGDFKNVTKICAKCKKEFSGDNFCMDRTSKDFLTWNCKNCMATSYQNVVQYIQQKKEEMGGSCQICGMSELDMLEFDHLERKVKSVTSMRSKKAIDHEAEKCQLLCVKCHRLKSARDRKEKYYSDEPVTCKSTLNRRKKYDFVNKIKLRIGQCQICEIKIDPEDENELCTFDFDHIDPSTKVDNVSNMCLNKFSTKRIQLEIDKCRLLCCFCHKKVTWNEKVV